MACLAAAMLLFPPRYAAGAPTRHFDIFLLSVTSYRQRADSGSEALLR